MRVGSLVFATDQGLGILAKSFYDHGVITDVAVVCHGRRPEHDDWYLGSPRAAIPIQISEYAKDLAKRVDVMLFFETPFVWHTIPLYREQGVRTALMPMVECMLEKWPYQPDLIINPSLLDQQYFPQGIHLPVPVCTNPDCPCTHKVQWRQRQRAEVFVHNAGWGGLRARNGTAELLEAWRLIKSPARLILRSQSGWSYGKIPDKRIDFRPATIPYQFLYGEGDVFIFPDKFQGLSLPLQEARAAGMLVMATDRFPNNAWLPREPLLPVREYRKVKAAPRCVEVDEAIIDPKAIAAKIDDWYGQDISAYSSQGKEWAEENSWDRLKPEYLKVLGG